MLTTVYGHETEADKRVIRALEAKFNRPLVYFLPIVQPNGTDFGYWHCRIANETGILFVRQDDMAGLHIYGPIRGETLPDPD